LRGTSREASEAFAALLGLANFDINLAATHCIRLLCEDCARLSILPVPGPGVDEDRPWLCPACAPDFEPDFRQAKAARWQQVEEYRMSPEERQLRRRWRFYRTAAGHEPVADFLNRLDRDDRAAVAAKLRQVVGEGVTAARHLRGEIREVRPRVIARASECFSRRRGGGASCSPWRPCRRRRSGPAGGDPAGRASPSRVAGA
jgi:hypothetical protein